MDELERQLDAARLALVALLAVVTDDQFRSVRAALEALHGVSEASHAALKELSMAAVDDEYSSHGDA